MKRILISFLLCTAFNARATLPVVDYSHIAQDAANQVVNVAHYAQTELNTLRQWEAEVVQLARMGDPNQLKNLPVIGDVARVASSGQQLMYDYQEWKSFANPQNFQLTANSILSQYSQPIWNGFVTAGGVQINPSQSAFQFPVSQFNISTQAEQQIQALEKQRQTLINSRDSTLQQIQSASDQSTVQKLHAALDGINAALAEIGQRETAIRNEAALKGQQVTAAQAVSQAAQNERQAANNLQTADQEFQTIGTLGGIFQPVPFGGGSQ